MPDPTPTLVVRSRRVLTPDGLKPADVVIAGERIVALRDPGEVPAGAHLDDAGDLVVMPGLVDSHVHVNEPGRTEWEGFETATRAAAAGGITTIADMPLNCTPVTTTRAALATKLAAIEGLLHVDCAFWGGLVPGNGGELEGLADDGVVGVKAFMIHSGIDDFPHCGEAELRAGMTILGARGLPLLAHAELAGEGEEDVPFEDTRAYQCFLDSRPQRWEVDAIGLLAKLLKEVDCRVHVVHLSAADALGTIRAARAAGYPLSVETCPHYLTLSAEKIADGDTAFKCCPPIREDSNRSALWGALAAGEIDQVVSDHSPCTPDLKKIPAGDFEGAWGGIASLQLGLPIIWTEAKTRGHEISDLYRWMSQAPAKLLGLEGVKGGLTPGFDGDLVVWDPDGAVEVHPDFIQHRHKITPYQGMNLTGRIYRTYLRGRMIHDAGDFPAGAVGRPVFHPASHAAQEAGAAREEN